MQPTSTSIISRKIDSLRSAKRNARTHSRRQIDQIAQSLETFGFVNPVLIDAEGRIVAGHGRVAAARRLGLSEVPTLSVTHLSPEELRAYAIADNRLAELAGWDEAVLKLELGELAELELDFDLEVTGFETAKIDALLRAEATDSEAVDEPVPIPPTGSSVSRPGDLWQRGPHRVLCGDARDRGAVRQLMDGESARVVFTDPPYNVRIDGHVCGLGKVRHREFAMASGEMSEGEFATFLETTLANAVAVSLPGALHYVCMDWRHMMELQVAGRRVYSELKNLCVWNKTNGGMGSLYRSKHELVFVFKAGTAAHVNNVALGRLGRYRCNVWDYAGVNTWRKGRTRDLDDHPTVKPVRMVADAIEDASHRDDVVLDLFGGAGTTLIAAAQTGRRARLMEIDPAFVDVTITRWQQITGGTAVHAGSGQPFGVDTPTSAPVRKRRSR